MDEQLLAQGSVRATLVAALPEGASVDQVAVVVVHCRSEQAAVQAASRCRLARGVQFSATAGQQSSAASRQPRVASSPHLSSSCRRARRAASQAIRLCQGGALLLVKVICRRSALPGWASVQPRVASRRVLRRDERRQYGDGSHARWTWAMSGLKPHLGFQARGETGSPSPSMGSSTGLPDPGLYRRRAIGCALFDALWPLRRTPTTASP